MTPYSLDSSGGLEFREEADNHAQSLPTAAPEGKLSIPTACSSRPLFARALCG
jgi:hypothetical protein